MGTQEIGADGFPKSAWQLPPETVDAMKAAGVGPGSTASAATAPFNPAPAVAPKRVPVVVDLSGRPMSKTYDLDWPKSVDGVEIRQVVAHRVSTAEVSAFIDRVRDAPDGESLPFPIFRRVDGVPLTAEEWSQLDDDDTYRMVKDADGFLPARWRAVTGNTPSDASPQLASTTTSNSSAQ